MIEIEDPPSIRACSQCASALGWMYSAKRSVWISVVRLPTPPGRPALYQVHDCPVFGESSSYRHVKLQPAEVFERGRELARSALEAKSGIEKEKPDHG